MDQDQPDLSELRDLVQALRAELGGFRQEQIAMIRRVQELNDNVVEIQNYLKSQPSPAAPPVLPPDNPPALIPHYRTLHNPPLPKRFSGDPLEFSAFLTQCKLHFLHSPHLYDTDHSKVLFVLMSLEGSALSWATPYINREDPILKNYASFIEAFSHLFERKLEKELRENELFECQQGKKGLIDYITRFHLRAAESQWPEKLLIKLYYRGLDEELKDYLSKINPLPTSFVKYLELTVQIDQRLKERRKEKHVTSFKPNMPQPMEDQVSLDYPDAEEPMQIGALYKPVYSSERERRRLEGLCFYCGDDRHYLVQCPLRPQRNPNPTVPRKVPVVHIPIVHATHEEIPQTKRIASVRTCAASKEVKPVPIPSQPVPSAMVQPSAVPATSSLLMCQNNVTLSDVPHNSRSGSMSNNQEGILKFRPPETMSDSPSSFEEDMALLRNRMQARKRSKRLANWRRSYSIK